MSKAKSAVCLVLMTLLIAGLIFVCFIPFQFGHEMMNTFHPVAVSVTFDTDLGLPYGNGYNGGGYSAVYYPEGVISAREYEERCMDPDADKVEEVRESYTQVGSLYFETDTIELKDGKPNETFQEDFQKVVSLLQTRYERLHSEGARLDIVDGYTVRAFVPAANAAAFSQFALMGEVTVAFGSSEDSATTVMPAANDKVGKIGDYISGVSSTSQNGYYYVVFDFTDKGQEALRNATANAETTSGTMYFKVGDTTALSLSVTAPIDMDNLAITNGSFTSESAEIAAVLLDTSLAFEEAPELTIAVGEILNLPAGYGDNALLFLAIALAACVVAMMVFFFVRYGLLAFAHLYTFLIYLCGAVLCIWAIPFVVLSVEVIVALLLTTVLLSISDVIVFENARKDYAMGKTIASSVKGAYKKSFWHLFDLHIVLALFGFVAFFIALPSLSSFSFIFGLTTVFSGLGCLVLTRFHWAIMMAYTENKGSFCNFKREEAENE